MTEYEKSVEVKATDRPGLKQVGGTVLIGKPLADAYNKAVMAAETPEGMKISVMLIELLPSCVLKHPWPGKNVKEFLGKLEPDQHDKLVDALRVLINPPENVEGKSEPSSEPKDLSSTGGSEASTTSGSAPGSSE